MFTSHNLAAIFPRTPARIISLYIDPLNQTIRRFNITTRDRAAAFIAQVGHESGHLHHIIENLNYSSAGLLSTFPRHFTRVQASQYARQPVRIASRVYANRMGNGNEASQDGWTFRGRGLIQITGRNNYTRLAAFLKITVPETITYLETTEGAAISAGWFWSDNKLNPIADRRDFVTLTRRINGGTNGMLDRQELWNRALSVL